MHRSTQHLLITASALGSVLAALLVTAGVQGVAIADLPTAKPETVGMSSMRLNWLKATI